MTHTYKVGDKGKTRGGDDYEVTAVGETCLLAKVSGVERSYMITGGSMAGSLYDLTPPERRIQGFLVFWENGAVTLSEFATGWSNKRDVLAIKYIDIEEGEGL